VGRVLIFTDSWAIVILFFFLNAFVLFFGDGRQLVGGLLWGRWWRSAIIFRFRFPPLLRLPLISASGFLFWCSRRPIFPSLDPPVVATAGGRLCVFLFGTPLIGSLFFLNAPVYPKRGPLARTHFCPFDHLIPVVLSATLLSPPPLFILGDLEFGNFTPE